MTLIRFYTDEDVHGVVAPQLRAAGFDAVSASEVNRLEEPDDAQLDWSAQQGRVIVSFNVGDFVRLHCAWMKQGRNHPGIIVSRQFVAGETIRRLLRLSGSLSGDEMVNRLEFLSNW